MTSTTDRTISRRAALGGGVGFTVAFLAACSGKSSPKTGNESTSSIDALPGPQRLRAQATLMEPKNYAKTYVVDASGKNGAHRTFADAYTAILADRQTRIGIAAPSQSNPWDWRLIKVMPGSYHETIKGNPPHTAIIGQGNKPEDVHIWWDGGDNTYESTGQTTYLRNLHLDHTGPQADAHAMRDAGHAGDIGLQDLQCRTVVFESVRFSSLRSASLGKCTNDMSPMGGTSMTFFKCVFNGPGQPQSINLITDQGGGKRASTISFLSCTVISNFEQHPDKSLAENGTVQAAPFGAPDFSHGRGDTLVWMDGHWNVGRVGGMQALLAFPYIADKGQTGNSDPRPSTKYVLVNPGTVPGMKTSLTTKALPPTDRVDRSVNLPIECFSDVEKSFFGAKPPTKMQKIGPAASGTVKVKAGDVYWLKIDIKDQCVFAQGVEIGRGGPDTMGVMAAIDDAGKPQVNGNGQTSGSATGGSGTAQLQPRWFYPGQGPVWVGVAFATDGEVPATKAGPGQALHGSGANGGVVPAPSGLSPVASGTLVPRVLLHNQLPNSMQ